MLLYLLQVQIAPVTPVPPVWSSSSGCGRAGSGGSCSELARGGSGVPTPGPSELGVPCPVPQPNPAVPCLGRVSLARHPAWTSQELRGAFPEFYLHGGSGGSCRRRFIFTVGVCGTTWAQFSLTSPRASGPEMASPRGAGTGEKGHGKKLSPL